MTSIVDRTLIVILKKVETEIMDQARTESRNCNYLKSEIEIASINCFLN